MLAKAFGAKLVKFTAISSIQTVTSLAYGAAIERIVYRLKYKHPFESAKGIYNKR